MRPCMTSRKLSTLIYNHRYEAIDEFGTKAILVRAGVIIGLYIAWDVYRFVQRKRHDRFL